MGSGDGGSATDQHWTFSMDHDMDVNVGEGIVVASHTNPDGQRYWRLDTDSGIIFEMCLRRDSFQDEDYHLPGSGEKRAVVNEWFDGSSLTMVDWVWWTVPGEGRGRWSQNIDTLRVVGRVEGELEWVSRVPLYFPGDNMELTVTLTLRARRVG